MFGMSFSRRFYLKFWLGRLANLAGYPMLVRECDYKSKTLNASIRVKRLELYTLLSVNGLDIYFSRLTGAIEAVGPSRNAGRKFGDAKIRGPQCSVEFSNEARRETPWV
jgi:hypothetical protein